MCGGLYIETAAMKTLGDWLREQTMYSVAVETINNAQGIGGEHFQAFVKECLIERSKVINDVTHRNKFNLFNF